MESIGQNKSKPPYLLGLLCLVPLVGAFVGLGLLLYGLIKYKDKWLSIIGAFGILFTVGIYGSLFYYSKNGDSFKEGFEELSQMQLNSLVKDIEFYNLEHGYYPDDIKLLLQEDKLAHISDPLQSLQKRENIFYTYKKLGDKYTVYSRGQDGIPNTKDDLFPKIIMRDSSKIGLIKIP